jgi:hypothetical protein
MKQELRDQRGYFEALIGDGRPLLTLTGFSLILAGGFALFLSATRQFLPHDIQFLGMTANSLCAINDCKVVLFMFHDRVAFGGTLIAIGSLYMWLSQFPLREGQAWAWWLFLLTGLIGFGSFLAYLGYGYLDTWHGSATLLLLPVFILGLIRSYTNLSDRSGPRSLLRPHATMPWVSPSGIGRVCLLATAAGMMLAGITILVVGMTSVFVPQDLEFMATTAMQMDSVNPRLVPLIAHDRAGFGGGILTCGICVFFCVWCGRPSRSLWQVLVIAALAGFGTAIGVHPAVGYINLLHLAPAFVGALIFGLGMVLSFKTMHG